MGPSEVTKNILAIANYIDGNEYPDLVEVEKSILDILANRTTAGKVTKFVHKDFEIADRGMNMLIDRLSKAAKTLNPQDEARGALESVVDHFMDLRNSLKSGFESLKSVEI